MNEEIENILRQAPQGETTSDDVLKRNVVKEVIYKQSDLITVGTDVVPERTFGALDVNFNYPGEIDGEYPVQENSVVDRQRVTWSDFDLELHQAEARFMITDIARLREQGDLQNEMSTRRAAEAIAKEKDDNILSTLHGGSPSGHNTTLTRADDEGWDQANGDPEGDIMSAWNSIFEDSNVNEDDIERTYVIAPSKVYSELNSLQLINNVQQNLRDYINDAYGIQLRFSRLLDDDNDAIVAVGGDQTALHGVLDTDEIPLVEQQREFGRGEDTLIKQFFNTAIVEDEGLTNESYRIARVDNVSA